MKVTLSSEVEHNREGQPSNNWQEYSFEDKPKMTIELRKVFNLLRPTELLLLLMEVLVVVLACYRERFVWGIFIVPILPFGHCIRYSKTLTVEPQIIKYKFYRKMRRSNRPGWQHVYLEAGGRPETVEFRQNIIEKIFNAGHIRFVEVGTSRKRSVYGITNFDETKQKIERVLKTHY